MPDSVLSTFHLPPTGETVLTPPLAETSRFAYRAVVEGVVGVALTDHAFDAIYLAGRDGNFETPHDYLLWKPERPEVVEEDRARHRYVFRFPDAWEGQSAGLAVNVDRFVEEFLIPPSEVRAQLSGDFRVTFLRASLAPASLWVPVAAVSLPAAVLLGGAGWVLRRRIAFRGLDPDLREHLAQIERKSRLAGSAARTGHARLFPLRERIRSLQSGSLRLARQIQSLRRAQALRDPAALWTEAERLRARLPNLTDPSLRREAEAALVEKERARDLLEELSWAENRCAMRLARVEAVLDTACLTLSGAGSLAAAPAVEQSLLRDLDAEVAAIGETARDLRSLEAS